MKQNVITNSKRILTILLAMAVLFTFSMVAQTDKAYAASKEYYVNTNVKVTVKYSGFINEATRTWKGADFSYLKGDLDNAQSGKPHEEFSPGVSFGSSGGPSYYSRSYRDDLFTVPFGTIKQKVTAKVSVGKLTSEWPKRKHGNVVLLGKKKSRSAANKAYKKVKANAKKKPLYYAAHSNFSFKNYPAVTVAIGDKSFSFFKVNDQDGHDGIVAGIALAKSGKIKKTKKVISGKYTAYVGICYKDGVTNKQVEEFLTAVTSMKSGDTIRYSFKTPKIKSKDYLIGAYGDFLNTYSGYKSVANKQFEVTETVQLK
jgi:hypothetical protein